MTIEDIRMDWREVTKDPSHNVDTCTVCHLLLASPLVNFHIYSQWFLHGILRFSPQGDNLHGFRQVRKICLKVVCYVQHGQGLVLAKKHSWQY